jgi:hypothetical protein
LTNRQSGRSLTEEKDGAFEDDDGMRKKEFISDVR